MMVVEFHRPGPPLDRFIRHFVFFEGMQADHAADRLLPDGGIDLIFDLTESPKKLFDNDDLTRYTTLKRSWISGLRTGFITIDAAGSSMFNIHFRADGAYPFFRMPLTGIRDRVVELDCVIGNAAHDFRDALLAAATPAAKFRVASQRLLAMARMAPAAEPVVQYAVDRIDGRPDRARIADITSRTGYTHKHFVHLFEKHTGLTPKYYARIMKFQLVLGSIERSGAVDWPQLAIECGYYDQSHFINEFRRFSGINPASYLAARGEHLNYLPLD
jgi:methylphosphotriester-DNA--protein-cysteine methyltransferase